MDHLKGVVDGISYSVVIGALIGALPQIAAGVSLIWMGIQAYYFFKDRKGK